MPAITISEEWPSFCVRNCADVGIPVCEKNDANISSDEQTHAHTCSHKVCRTGVLSDVCVLCMSILVCAGLLFCEVAHLILWLLFNNCCWKTNECYTMYKHYILDTIRSAIVYDHHFSLSCVGAFRMTSFFFAATSLITGPHVCTPSAHARSYEQRSVRPKCLINGHNVASCLW